MIRLIAHRGNTAGPKPERENDPEYLLNAVDKGFDCEVDVWFINDRLWLGHDEPTYAVTQNFISNNAFWNHAKNLEALEFMLVNNIHCFWHEQDERTLTSKGYIWTYPNKQVTTKSVICLQNEKDAVPEGCFGICSDWVSNYENSLLRKTGWI